MRKLIRLGHNVWGLVRGYWGSEERWSAWALLTAIILLNLGIVYVNVLLNQANAPLYDALQKRDEAKFFSTFGTIALFLTIYLAVALLRYYLNQTLQIRWRRWLTARYLTRWTTGRAFYRMRFKGTVDNPDQRISEDIRLFISQSLSLGLGLLSASVTFFSFAAILWHLSGSLTVSLGGMTITIPGYMFWAALVYSGIGSIFAHLVGRPLIRLGNRQQGFEADFRFGLVRMREEAEGIALYGGEARERGHVLGRFAALYGNFRRLILRNTQYLVFEIMIGQLASFFPILVAAPRYFSGGIELGQLMQTANAFGQVNGALSWFIDNYTTFADWRATVDRLTEFSRELDEAPAPAGGLDTEAGGHAIRLENLATALPDGRPLLAPMNLMLEAGEPVLLRGASGSGKSTLFRALAGLWPFASGRISLPAGARPLFLPQRPYMPIGTLREALWFPAAPESSSDEAARAALAAVQLPGLSGRLDENGHWSQMLSTGEQQRLAVARALLLKPDWLFLDEATSAMDEVQEAILYRTLARTLPETTIVSIGHRPSLAVFHQRVMTLEREGNRPAYLVESLAAE
ncbi:MAG TPA: ABC transporter ATP-binding protein/permease [Aliidongia sp.]|nr:ABC transporter ATP-binding protein/permease [Aliidongia sp.]